MLPGLWRRSAVNPHHRPFKTHHFIIAAPRRAPVTVAVIENHRPDAVFTGSLPALIANRTNPSLGVRVIPVSLPEGTVARIQVPKSRHLVATSEGLLQRRRLKLDGTPEAVPFYPHEFMQRQSGLGMLDPSALPLEDIAVDQLDPLQRLRLRNAVRKYGGEQSLLPLADDELDGALGLTVEHQGRRVPTVAGLLLLGTEPLLRRYLPAYEVAFQVLRGTDVQVNEFYRKPLLETFEEVELQFKPWVVEEELQVGLFRVSVPNYDRRAFREALVNALVHRDFSRLGAVHVKLDSSGLHISNPGGFIEGVTLDNLLVAPPHSRNPLLADISSGSAWPNAPDAASTASMKACCAMAARRRTIPCPTPLSSASFWRMSPRIEIS